MKTEYEPLFPAGFHYLHDGDLDGVFVAPFSNSDRRELLIRRFRALIRRVAALNIPCEVWLDGSFATMKPDPEDIDLLFTFDTEAVNTASDEAKEELAAIFGEDGRAETRLRYGCDVYVIASDDDPMRSYWRGWFGYTRDEKPKGIPSMRIGL